MMYRSISRLAVITALVALGACGNDDTASPTAQTAKVRVVNLLPTAPSAGLYADGRQVGSNVAFGSASATCMDFPVGQAISFGNAGDPYSIARTGSTFAAAGNYTMVLYARSGSPVIWVFNDANVTAPTAGNNSLRVVNATDSAGDVWITPPNAALSGTPSLANVPTEGTLPTFQSYPTADTQIRLFNPGTTTGTPRVNTTFSSTNLSSSRVGTAFLTGLNQTGSSTNASVVAAPCA